MYIFSIFKNEKRLNDEMIAIGGELGVKIMDIKGKIIKDDYEKPVKQLW